MKFGLLAYDIGPSKKFNVGDHIQSLAAKQYLPRVDTMIRREYLNSLNLENKTSTIMNGWYTQHPQNWPPEELLNPFFVSFHLNSNCADEILSRPENVEYLKKYAPIGCRDTGTVRYLKQYGVDAYYSSCLTTTLDLKYKSDVSNDDILIVDVLYKDDLLQQYKDYPKKFLKDILTGDVLKVGNRMKLIKSIIPKKIIKNAKILKHTHREADFNEEEQFKLGEDLLHKYAKAKLVIT
ncbi:polysaccharide pyruvyl transferase family protein, partial [Bacteroidia bacterium]|nr:polysaccharide pyruvyl transferase family protein [Bacteroidia bacterium]